VSVVGRLVDARATVEVTTSYDYTTAFAFAGNAIAKEAAA